ncbi:PREDICTED: ribosomal L1 domain-containing protein 1-like [Camelina sativa]|uniref:Ribosomal L1 domain-containing protein 1-like n=1 Tax=Camelina sativa TaxID=90675 RepID=A0ABM0YXZ8_CAMSA|nr:PREDICTED: ribosomal L1 domain-containing protein 1-like [Camelina sativa]
MTTAAQPQPLPEQVTTLPKTVNIAIKALFERRNEKRKTKKPHQLLEEDESVYLTVDLNTIPQTHQRSAYRISLPHPLINTTEDSPKLCLIVDNGKKSGLKKEKAVKKIKSENIPITTVLELSKLKSDYKSFESRQKLCDSYERFFCDRRVIHVLPRVFGKKFFGSKKIPVAIDTKKNWKGQIEKACRGAMFFIRTGICSVIKVGTLSMERDEIVENVMATVNGVVDSLPDKWTYVRSLHLKLSESLDLPIYQTMPDDLKLKVDPFGVKDGEELVKSDDIDDGSKSLKKKKKKGRIHEVIDDDENQMNLEDDEVDGDLNGSRDKKKRKKMSSSESEVSEKQVKKSKQKNVLKSKKLKNDIDESGGGLKAKKTKRRKEDY